MEQNFDRCWTFTQGWEGGAKVTKDPTDPGGTTKFGDGDKSNNDPENLLKCTRRSHLWMHQAMAYWYQIEVVRKMEIKTRKGLVRFLLNKAHEHIDGMALNVGRNNGDIIPNDLMEIAAELGCVE